MWWNNEINKSSKFNLLMDGVLNYKNTKDWLKIVEFLIAKGIDINYILNKLIDIKLKMTHELHMSQNLIWFLIYN